MDNTRVLLVDDQVLFIESLERVINNRAKGIEIVGIAYNGKEAVELTEKLKPDVILMDIRMPKINGVQASRIILEKFPHIKVVLLTNFEEDDLIRESLKIGVSGFLLKEISPDQLILSLSAVQKKVLMISSPIIKKILLDQEEEDIDEPDFITYSSYREIQILKFLCNGLHNKEIALELNLSEQTVKNKLSVIYSKLQVRDRVQAIEKVRDYFAKIEA